MGLLGSKVRRLTAMHAVDSIERTGVLYDRGTWLVPEYRSFLLGEARLRLKAVMPARVGAGLEPKMRIAAGQPPRRSARTLLTSTRT